MVRVKLDASLKLTAPLPLPLPLQLKHQRLDVEVAPLSQLSRPYWRILLLLLLLLDLWPQSVRSLELPLQLQLDADGLDELNGCQFNYLRLPVNYVQLSVYILQFSHHQVPSDPQMKPLTRSEEPLSDLENGSYIASFKRLDLEDNSSLDLRLGGLDPSRPFKIFMSGFNPNQVSIQDSWMRRVAQVLITPDRVKMSSESNVIFISWHISSVFADNMLSLIPAYYKTMANFWTISRKVQASILKLMALARPEFLQLNSTRINFHNFTFYGHSLGSHIIARALRNIHADQNNIRFGQLVGLDPAEPCFSDEALGISESKLKDSLDRLTIVHSNAGLAGVYSARGQVEIVLNGGTFQPNCSWYDLTCHHSRSTDIFGYIDDTCQMVAFVCQSYEQFKFGACQVCLEDQDHLPKAGRRAPNCLLVNMEEQHLEMEHADASDELMRYKRNLDEDLPVQKRIYKFVTPSRGYKNTTNSSYYYVNTDPNHAYSRSHCLQHYQIRLLILQASNLSQSNSDMRNCPASKFILNPRNQINLQLYYEESKAPGGLKAQEEPVSLVPLIGDHLFTGLLTFPGKPRIFSRAAITNIDFGLWSQCLQNHGSYHIAAESSNQTGYKFLLDLAFMSNTKAERRYAHSSILCGHMSDDPTGGPFDMSLCKVSKLIESRDEIDATLSKIKFNNQFNSWQTSVLNGLFWLFTGWEPLR